MLNLLHRVTCRGIQSFDVPRVWETVKPLIERGLQRGSNYTIEDVFKGLRSCEMQLWVAETDHIIAALITTIQTSGDVTYCLLLSVGGSDLHEWIDAFPALKEWAQDKGCSELRIYGREGWLRFGFEKMYTAMRLEL